jgi:hypothetical protein
VIGSLPLNSNIWVGRLFISDIDGLKKLILSRTFLYNILVFSGLLDEEGLFSDWRMEGLANF